MLTRAWTGRSCALLLCAAAALAQEPAPPAGAEALTAQVERAVDRGVQYLLRRQLRDGSWHCHQQGFPGGQTALCAYALLHAGLPREHPAIERAFDHLDTLEPQETYSAGLMLLAYEALGDERRRPRLAGLLARLIDWSQRGEWGYPRVNENNFERWITGLSAPDLSNTQYAVLGLRAAQRSGLEVPEELWRNVIARALAYQERPRELETAPVTGRAGSARTLVAGFGYHPSLAATASMTAAGISVVCIGRDALGSRLRGALAAESQTALELGTAWLAGNFPLAEPIAGNVWHYYLLYGIERAGTLLGVEYFGEHAWYEQGARWLLAQQDASGSWAATRSFGVGTWLPVQEEPDTCFALLFLRRATRPGVATREPGSLHLREPPPDPLEDLRLACIGTSTVTLGVRSFADRALARHGGGALGGLRVARVEYLADGRLLGSVAGDPTRAWDDEHFLLSHTFVRAGRYVLQARAHLVAPDAPAGAREPTIVIESRQRVLVSEGVFEDWMQPAARARARNLLLAAAPALTASSHDGADLPGRACDGLQGTRWASAQGDGAPMLILELEQPVRADRLVLSCGAGFEELAPRYDRLRAVSVRFDRDKTPLVFELPEDELAPAVLRFERPRSVRRLELRVLRQEPRTGTRGQVCLSEVALERSER